MCQKDVLCQSLTSAKATAEDNLVSVQALVCELEQNKKMLCMQVCKSSAHVHVYILDTKNNTICRILYMMQYACNIYNRKNTNPIIVTNLIASYYVVTILVITKASS